MGSFNVSCGLSSLPIGYSDKAGFVILRDTTEHSNMFGFSPKDGKSLEIGPIKRYVPLLPPIFGKYDTYGRLENIEPSATTELLEKIFHKPIAVIAQCIGADRNVYSNYSPIFENYFLDKVSFGDAYQDDKDFDTALTSVGFAKEDVDHLSYKYEDYRLFRDGRKWKIQIISTEKIFLSHINVNYPSDLLAAFADVTNIFLGFAPEDWSSVKALSKLSGMFFLPEIVTKVAKTIDYSEWREDTFLEDCEDFLKTYDVNHKPTSNQQGFSMMRENLFEEEIKTGRRMHTSAWGLRTNIFLGTNTSLTPQQYDLLDIYPNGEEFSILRDLITVAEFVSRPLQPSMYVSESSDSDSLKTLFNVSLEIIAKREKERNDEYYDEED
jgi:hypothetical protein